ncbi:hypothetical protein SA22_2453 [Salmonella enterica subsp. enterica serovar Agona str. 22.H.04]|uniref:Uncharacterized protein n=1 Tax=Salmonella agona (strain SL483) TaxID=454166 RepID=B5F996_SALA4|nr:hypothetical protein SeAg_B2082 [Salmonella enterica subsp. enterica serovar Agona str. SL483]CCR02622.1 hypothetical protein SA73_3860 [Salmonella enterica subsp. enterica serovar Agona str. 73.H.09]CCR06092.1 hypothetical protein SA72_2662 [Salmonella enterica subsp. enterica serovar Agona str. 72.A.52]CCR11707.1 hypothetical protein SA71_3701 [Salmonella enterica subsp. enterica serovar Agona str. 71.E.05]CCR16215.1 hypothetical protein SA70_3605 [Salmonella enterica subsp. enterica serov
MEKTVSVFSIKPLVCEKKVIEISYSKYKKTIHGNTAFKDKE